MTTDTRHLATSRRVKQAPTNANGWETHTLTPMNDLALEILGYTASFFVVLSLTMTSVVKLRLISLVGSSTFLAYGLLIGALPIVVTNVVIVVINLVFLFKLFTKKEAFDLVEVAPESKFLERFLEHNASDIEKVWPGYTYRSVDEHLRLIVFRDLVPAGVFIASVEGRMATVELDYAARNFRDMKNARTLFGSGQDLLRSRGIDSVISPAVSEIHVKFLNKLGFRESASGLVLKLSHDLT